MEVSLLLSIPHYSFFFMAAALSCPFGRLGFAAQASTFTEVVARRELFLSAASLRGWLASSLGHLPYAAPAAVL